MKEIWKNIPGYEGLYQVSNLGRIKSLIRKAWNRFTFIVIKERILKPSIVIGYYQVMLYKNNNKKLFKIHKLVMLTFKGVCPKGKEINHIDCNKQNNRLDNLEYCTKSENIKHAWDNYLIPLKKYNDLKKIKVKQYDLKNNFLNEYESIQEASNYTNIPHSCIWACTKGRQKTVGKFIWRVV